MKGYKRVNQLGFVVKDMDRALKEYAQIYHIKQWYRAGKTPSDPMKYHGKPIKDPGFDLIIGYCGETEIELINTAAESSLYANFLKEGYEGLHHVSLFVKNLPKTVKEFKNMGFEVVQEGCMDQGLSKAPYAYMAKPGEGYGRIIELQVVKMFGVIPMTRNRFNLWFGSKIGLAEKLDMKKIMAYKL